MKRKFFVAGILAFALVFGMMVVGCDDSSGPQTLKYEGSDVVGNTYTLTITEKARAAYTAVKGDSYRLVVKMKDGTQKISSGTVSDIAADGTFTLKPSVPEAGTFRIVIDGKEISSVIGSITAEDGIPFMPSTFNTIYLRANRWTNVTEGMYGEQWSTGACVKISDFVEFEVGKSYTVIISGTLDTELKYPVIQFGLIKSNGVWVDGELGRGTISSAINGSFAEAVGVQTSVNSSWEGNLDGTENGFAQLLETLNTYKKNGDGTVTTYSNYGTLPEDISEGTIMATIRNFSMTVQDVQ